MESSPGYCFCACFDSNYLTRGLALYGSLLRHCQQPFMVWVLCLDDRTHAVLGQLHLDHMQLIALAELESFYPDLAAVKPTRNPIEYFWTCKSSLLLYVLEHESWLRQIVYLDADLYFFDDPQPLFEEIAQSSVAIMPHRFAPTMIGRAKRGIYNVGFLAFAGDGEGVSALRWWRGQCLEWCYARVEPTRYAEQKYLDDWPTRFENVVVVQQKGAGLGPWNWTNYEIERGGNGELRIDGEPLIFFHFAGARVINQWLYDTGLSGWELMPRPIRRWLYGPYMREIKRRWLQVRRLDTGVVLMDRVERNRFGPRVLVESLLDGQLGLIG